jgi:pimeloyl-ACP methyl ester carboxylesterase
LINLRTYGTAPFRVAVLHGGPGAYGAAGELARELGESAGVLEPIQTRDSIDGQVDELREVLTTNAGGPVVVIGHSWGAWLGWLLAARHPGLAGKLILVGSGPFRPHDADGIIPTRFERLSEGERLHALDIIERLNDPDSEKDGPMGELGALFERTDAYDPLPRDEEGLGYSEHINRQVWAEASELRATGRLLDMAADIRCPVVAIHGDYDPHPAEGVREPLAERLPDFTFYLLEHCGHTPWLERRARDRFHELLRQEIKS